MATPRREAGFTLLEIIVSVAIMAILATTAWFYVANYSPYTQATVDSHSLKTLNDALEDYKIYGGMSLSHSLQGPNSSTKISAVIAALEQGITLQGQRTPFINPGTRLNVTGITASGQGSNFVFSGYNSQQSAASAPDIQLGGNLGFGTVQTGSSAAGTLTITNNGSSSLVITSVSVPSGYSVNWTAGSIAAYGTQNVTVTFSPTQVQSYTGTVTVISSNAGSASTGIYGMGGNAALSLSGNLAFGTITAGTTATGSLAIQNTGTSPLVVNSISYPSGYSGYWSGTIPGGSTQTVTVTFLPTLVQSYNGTITVYTTPTSSSNTISVTGSGGQGVINVTNSTGGNTLAFGTANVGSSSTATMVITNNGTAPLVVSSITLPYSVYSLSWDSGTIPINGSQNVVVSLAPTADQGYNGTITVNSNAASGTNTISATGNGGNAVISLSGNMGFGTVCTGTTNPSTLTISNTGDAPLTVSFINLPSGYTASPGSGTIASGGNLPVTITFSPTQAQVYNGTLSVTSNAASGTSSMSITGTGTQAVLSLGGSGLAFGTCYDGLTYTGTLTIQNTTSSSLIVNSISYPYTCYTGAWSGTIPANGSQNVTVTFHPTNAGNYNGTITVNITSSCTSGDTIPVTATAVINPIISLSGSMNFGYEPANTSQTATLTISNTGYDTMTVSSITYPTGFTGNWSGGTIAVGANQPVTVTFAPTAVSTYSGTITVNCNAASGTNTISTSGSYGQANFVAVAGGPSTSAAYSIDGVSWTAATLPASDSWQSVTYGNGMYVAVASGSTNAAYSHDGVNWTAATLSASGSWNSVAFGGGYFVAVTNGTASSYSSNGSSWTAGGAMPASEPWYEGSLGGTFAAVAYANSSTAYSTNNGSSWTGGSVSTGYSWCAPAAGNGYIVTVGNGSKEVAYTSNGTSWTLAAALPSSSAWNAVAFGAGTFATIVSSATTTAYSTTNGASWTTGGAMPSGASWDAMAYGEGKFVAVASGATASAYSSNGSSWTSGNGLPSSAAWKSVASVGGSNITLSGTGLAFGSVNVGSSATGTLTITNNSNFTLNVSSLSYNNADYSGAWSGALAAGASQNVTVTFAPSIEGTDNCTITANCDAASGTNTFSATGTGVEPVIALSGSMNFGYVPVGATSTATLTIQNTGNATLTVNSISYPTGFSGNWSSGTIAASGSQPVTVTFTPTAAGTSYSGSITVSCTTPYGGTNTISTSGSYGQADFVAVAYGTANAAYSTDGITWPASNGLPSGANWDSVTYGNDMFVAISGSNSSAAAYSHDGVTWSSASLPAAGYWDMVTYGGGRFVATSSGTTTAYSTNGTSWSLGGYLPSGYTGYAVVYGAGNFVSFPYNASNSAYSSNGSSWTAGSGLPDTYAWYAVAYGNGTIVAVENSSVAAYSTNASSWTSASMPSSQAWYSMAYGAGNFVVISNGSSKTAYSTNNGSSWTAGGSQPSASYIWHGVAYGKGKFVCVSGSSSTETSYSSNGGTSWSAGNAMPATANWIAVASAGGSGISLSGNMAFGNVTHGTQATSTLTITNTSSYFTLNVSSISYPTGYSGSYSGAIAPGGSQNVTVTFSPSAVQSYNGTLTVNADEASGTCTDAVTGAGT